MKVASLSTLFLTVFLDLLAFGLVVPFLPAVARSYGASDAVAPLIGLLIGKSLLEVIGPWVQHLGPLLLCAYGVYVVYIARRYAGSETGETDRKDPHGMIRRLDSAEGSSGPARRPRRRAG